MYKKIAGYRLIAKIVSNSFGYCSFINFIA